MAKCLRAVGILPDEVYRSEINLINVATIAAFEGLELFNEYTG